MKKTIVTLSFLIITLSGYTQIFNVIDSSNSKPIQFIDGTVSEYARIVNLTDWRGVVVQIPDTIEDLTKAWSWSIFIDYDYEIPSRVPFLSGSSFPAFLTDPTPFSFLELEYQLLIHLETDSLIVESGRFQL